MNWDMPVSGMSAREFLLVMTIQGLCAALDYGPGVLVNSAEIVDDALSIVREAEKATTS